MLGDRVDFRIILDIAEHGMANGQFAELAGKIAVLIMVEMLVVEENHFPFQQGRADLLRCLR